MSIDWFNYFFDECWNIFSSFNFSINSIFPVSWNFYLNDRFYTHIDSSVVHVNNFFTLLTV